MDAPDYCIYIQQTTLTRQIACGVVKRSPARGTQPQKFSRRTNGLDVDKRNGPMPKIFITLIIIMRPKASLTGCYGVASICFIASLKCFAPTHSRSCFLHRGKFDSRCSVVITENSRAMRFSIARSEYTPISQLPHGISSSITYSLLPITRQCIGRASAPLISSVSTSCAFSVIF